MSSPISPAKAFPESEALGCHRQFAGVAVLLAAPAPVAARLFGADPALFHERDLHAAPGEIVGREDADDAAADHHHIGSSAAGSAVVSIERRGAGMAVSVLRRAI